MQLNVAERLWAAWYLYMQNDTLATGIMSFMMHEIVYFGRSLPWMLIDAIPAFNKYKIQNVSLAASKTPAASRPPPLFFFLHFLFPPRLAPRKWPDPANPSPTAKTTDVERTT